MIDDEAPLFTPAPAPAPAPSFRPLHEEVRELERTRIAEALAATSGNQTRAAALLDVPRRTFIEKMKQYGLRVPRGSRNSCSIT